MPPLPEPNFILPKHGDLQFGYFYELKIEELDFPEETGLLRDEGCIVSELPDLDWVETGKRYYRSDYIYDPDPSVTFKTQKLYDCSLNPKHLTRCYADYPHHIRLQLGPGVPPLIDLNAEIDYFIGISDEIAQRLEQTEFKGYKLNPIVIERKPGRQREIGSEYAKKDLSLKYHELQFWGKPCLRSMRVIGKPNACPYCGFGILECPECGWRQPAPCPGCGKRDLWSTTKDFKGTGDARLIITPYKDRKHAILDLNRWDGSDFVFTRCNGPLVRSIVTKRVVDWLLSIHAAPFVAKPVYANLDGISTETKQLLSLATQFR